MSTECSSEPSPVAFCLISHASRRSPAQRVRREEEEQGSERSFRRQAETETSGLKVNWPEGPREGGLGHCDDEPPWAKELAARRRRNSPAISLTPKLLWRNNPPAFSQKRVSTFLGARDFKMLGGSKFRLRQGFACGKTLVRRVRAAPSAMGPRPKRRKTRCFVGTDSALIPKSRWRSNLPASRPAG